MRIGIAGAHRTGKSTLAREIHSKMRVGLILTNAGSVYQAHGCTPVDDMPMSKRLAIQNSIVDKLADLWDVPGSWVSDRTPLDIIAYSKMYLSPVWADAIRARVEPMMSRFDFIFILRPAIPFVYDYYKAGLETAEIVDGYLMEEARRYVNAWPIPADYTPLNQRLLFVSRIVR